MLEELDTVDWAGVQHAYGEATDTPVLLRMLLDDAPERREHAYRHLFATLLDDCMRNAATAAAAPFLVELVGDPRTPGRARLLGMLACSVAGPNSLASPPILDDGGPDVHPILREIYRAAEVAVPHALGLVRADDEELCAAAVYFLSAMWRSADEIVPALHARLARSPGPTVRATIAFALGRLRPDDPALLALHADDVDRVVRVIAAAGLLHGATAERALDTIVAAIADPDGVPGLERLMCVEMGLADLGRVLCRAPVQFAVRAVPALCAALPRTGGFEVLGIVEPLLHAAFDASTVAVDPDALTPAQREVLAALFAHRAVWRIGNLHVLMQAYGLPSGRRSLAALLGLHA